MTQPIVCIDFPEEFQSERLTIRPPRAGDGPVVNRAIHDSFESLRAWMPWAKELPTLEESEEVCRKGYVNFWSREDLHLLLFNTETGELVGSSGLHRINWEVRKFEIGYWGNTKFARQGYITEAIRRIARFAFEELDANRVEIRVDEKNERSYRIPDKLGFTLEGTYRNDMLCPKGELRNTRVYSVVASEELL